MNVAERLMTQLVDAGVHKIYGIVGDSLNPIVGAICKIGGPAKSGIDWVHVRHEEAAAFTAATEVQLTGELSVCVGSCDPGNPYLTNGLYDVQHSGVPVLATASHIPSAWVGQSYFQEAHPDRLLNERSVYSELIFTSKQTPRVVSAAVRHAVSPSDVSVVSLLGDASDEKATAATPEHFETRPATLLPNPADVIEVPALFNKSRKMAIFTGVDIKGTHDEVVALADLLKVPIGHSLRGRNFTRCGNPYSIGTTGSLGYEAAAEGMKDADVLPLLGTDFPYDQFLPDTVTAQVDNRAERLGRRTDVSHPIHSDVISFIGALILHIKKHRFDAFLKAQLKKHAKTMKAFIGAYTRKVDRIKPIYPKYAAHVLNEVAAKDMIFTANTGVYNVWTAHHVDPLGTCRLIGSFLHGSMANALPHAIGVQIPRPHHQVTPAFGDGGLSMLMGELVTARMHNLSIKVMVFNNSALGVMKLEISINGLPDFGTDVHDVNYTGAAQSIGFHAERIDNPRDLCRTLQKAFGFNGSALAEVITDPNALSFPSEIMGGQPIGFVTAMSKIVPNRGAGEAVSMATSNMRNVPYL